MTEGRDLSIASMALLLDSVSVPPLHPGYTPDRTARSTNKKRIAVDPVDTEDISHFKNGPAHIVSEDLTEKKSGYLWLKVKEANVRKRTRWSCQNTPNRR